MLRALSRIRRASRLPSAPGDQQGLDLFAKHRAGGRQGVNVGLAAARTRGPAQWPHLAQVQFRGTRGTGQTGAVGVGSLDGHQRPARFAAPVDPTDGPLEARAAGGERGGVHDLPGGGHQDGVSVGAGVGVHADDVPVFSRTAPTAVASFPRRDAGRPAGVVFAPRQFSNESRPLHVDQVWQPAAGLPLSIREKAGLADSAMAPGIGPRPSVEGLARSSKWGKIVANFAHFESITTAGTSFHHYSNLKAIGRDCL